MFCGILFLLNSALCQSDTTATIRLDDVIITGQYLPQSLRKSVYQVKVISPKKIESYSGTDVQQILNTELGFRFNSDNTLGITEMKLNGMGGNSIKILLDGVPISDRYDQRVSLSHIDINTIERIEIVEGPMSVEYGTDAMSGLINIITKKNSNEDFSISALIQEETVGNEYYPFSYKGKHLQNIHVGYRKNNLSASLGAMHHDFSGWGGDEYGRGKTWKPKEQWGGNGRIGFGNSRTTFDYRVDAIWENITTRNPININNFKAIDQEFITHRQVHRLQNQYKINRKISLNTNVGYNWYSRHTNTFRKDFENNSTEDLSEKEGVPSQLRSASAKSSMLYLLSEVLILQSGIDFNHEKASRDRIMGTPEINDFSIFISGEIKPFSFLNLRPGLRFTTNSAYDAPPIIPSINTKIVLNDKMDLRLSYGRGFRAPSLRELYLTFVDANHNLAGNTQLEAEYSNSYNGSIHYNSQIKNKFFRSGFSFFYNRYTNRIDLLQSITDPTIYTYYNVNTIKTMGGSLENKISGKNIEIALGIAYVGISSNPYQKPNPEEQEYDQFLWSPEINSNILFEWKKLHTDLSLFFKYVGKKPTYRLSVLNGENVVLPTETSNYFLTDITLKTKAHKNIGIHYGIKNLWNVTNVSNSINTSFGQAHTSTGGLSVSYGRSYFLGISFQYAQKAK